MRIAYLTDSALPSTQANGVHVIRMAAAFASHGHEVILVGRPGDGSLGPIDSYYGVESPALDIHLVSDGGPPLVRTMVRRWRVRRLLERRGPIDVVYGRSANLLIAATELGAPVVYEIHALASSNRIRRNEQAVISAPATMRLVAITSALARDASEAFDLRDVEVLVAADAADPPTHGVAPRPLGGQEAGPRVGYVGSFFAGRGLERVAAVAEAIPTVGIHLAGADQIQPSLALPNVHSYGRLAPTEVSSLLSALDIGLAPFQRAVSVAGGGDTARWMSPLKIFEYLAHGLAVVASDLPVLREVLDDEVAILVDPDDDRAWVAAIESLIEDQARLQQMQEAARERFRERHTWYRRAARVLEGLGR